MKYMKLEHSASMTKQFVMHDQAVSVTFFQGRVDAWTNDFSNSLIIHVLMTPNQLASIESGVCILITNEHTDHDTFD